MIASNAKTTKKNKIIFTTLVSRNDWKESRTSGKRRVRGPQRKKINDSSIRRFKSRIKGILTGITCKT